MSIEHVVAWVIGVALVIGACIALFKKGGQP